LPSTPSSPDSPRRPSRGAIVALAAISILLPLGLLLFVLAGDDDAAERPDDDLVATGDCADTSVTVEPGPAPGIGDVALDFSAMTLACEPFRLSDWRGQPVVLTFFASWCHPCEEEMPLLEAAHAEDDQFEVVAVSYEDLRGDSVAFVDRLGVTYPAVFDEDTDVAAAYGVHGIPQTLFIDAEGVVREKVFGITTEEAVREPLDALLALTPPSETSAPQ
jgi:cytochrome c biogenesis protein CcmG/thiol:disulfide interchange protein DsbE